MRSPAISRLETIHEDQDDPTPTPTQHTKKWVVCRRHLPAVHCASVAGVQMFVVTSSILVNRNSFAECVCETREEALGEMRRRAFVYQAANWGDTWYAYDSEPDMTLSLWEDEKMAFLGFKIAFYVDGPVDVLEGERLVGGKT